MDTFALLEDERLDFINEELRLIQKKDGLTFGTDAYLLSAFVKAKTGAVAVDLGSGTGVASFLCAVKNKASKIFSVEIQEEFFDLIRRNAEMNSLSEKIFPLCMDIRDVSSSNIGCEADIVFSNPPYMKENGGFGSKSSQMNIARREIFGGIFDFCSAAKRLLKYGGVFYTVYRPDRLIDLISSLRENSLEPKRITFVYPDTSSKPCLVLTEAKYGGASGVIVTEPLIIYKDNTRDISRRGEYTDKMNRVYETCSIDL